MASEFLQKLEGMLFFDGEVERFTVDTPIFPEVWRGFAKLSEARGNTQPKRLDLLLTPHRNSSAADLMCSLIIALHDSRYADQKTVSGKKPSNNDWLKPYSISATETHVSVQLNFEEMICVALPMTSWWRSREQAGAQSLHNHIVKSLSEENPAKTLLSNLGSTKTPGGKKEQTIEIAKEARWFVHISAWVWWRMENSANHVRKSKLLKQELLPNKEIKKFVKVLLNAHKGSASPLLYGISMNRKAVSAIDRSVPTIKADAACELFKPDTSRITWAVIDSGIDATHPAFRKRDKEDDKPLENAFTSEGDRILNNTRVIETYDFTKMRSVLALRTIDLAKNISQMSGAFEERAKQLRSALASGRLFDWDDLLEELRLIYPEDGSNPHVPVSAHGTHVAGILGSDWEANNLKGVCPKIKLFDLRVVDSDGIGDEFSILAALHFIQHRNATADQPVIHGVNISMSIAHDVRNYACGRTPVCESCDRLVSSGVVVVAAAGNRGFAEFSDDKGQSFGYRPSGITDPGNAESVITVGATHRHQPHNYGVSFFSSRGPTGDGRVKPDLVAPGEKVDAPVPGNKSKQMDGTSMAAPHVSGGAALLLARHRELIGQPEKVKEILCQTATDLGRERHFQGAGMLDILRALQSI